MRPEDAARLNVRLFLRPTAVNLLSSSLAVAAAVTAGLHLVARRPLDWALTVGLSGAGAGAVVGVALFLLRSRAVGRRAARSGGPLRGRVCLEAHQVSAETEAGAGSQIPWSAFVGWVEVEGGIALFLSRTQFLWLPRPAFRPGDWEELRALVAGRVPRPSRR